MAHHEVVEVNVKKELLLSLVGVVAFALVVALVAVTAFLRPAGDHPNVAELNKASTASVASEATASAPASSPAPATASATATAQASASVASASK